MELLRIVVGRGGRGGLKATMALIGFDCGFSRLPTRTCTAEQGKKIRAELDRIGFFQWAVVKQ